MAEAALQKNNSILNILDPPKDLADSLAAGYGPDLIPLLKELFWPYLSTNQANPIPRGAEYKGVADTKPFIQDALGSEKKAGPYSDFFTNKARQILILREKSTSGYTAKPSGLFVSQDAGPKDVVDDPKFIITPGTILDPATKEKDGTYFTKSIDGKDYNKLPITYITKLNLQNIINGQIEATETSVNDAVAFKVKIPVKSTIFGTDKIEATLLKSTFKPAEGDNTAPYFKGNKTKNDYIETYYNKINKAGAAGNDNDGKNVKNEIKKYLLVKELGDTLQVQWLNYLFDVSPVDQAATEELPEIRRYNKGNTVIITNDTVVLYRSLINNVPVLLTYGGKSILYKSADATATALINAAMIKTTRDEVIAHNESIIKVIQDVVNTPATAPKYNWISGLEWKTDYLVAKTYLTNLIAHLKNFNKDLDVYFSKMPSPDAADELAKRSHFLCPFVWAKGEQHYKTIDKVTDLLKNTGITTLKFVAKEFRPLTTVGEFQAKLNNSAKFVKVTAQGGGRYLQTGGARKNKTDKENLAKKVNKKKVGGREVPASQAETIANIQALLNESIREFLQPGIDHVLDRSVTDKVARTDPKPVFVGNLRGFTDNNQLWIDNTGFTGDAAGYTMGLLSRTRQFLYCIVRDYFPETFVYGYIVQSVLNQARYSNVTIDLATKYDIDYYIKDDPDKTRFLIITDVADDTFEPTMNAIHLAIYLTDTFPSLLTQKLADFFALMKKYLDTTRGTYPTVALDPEVLLNLGGLSNLGLQGQGGGGKPQDDLLASLAIANYEIYYSLAIAAAYDRRTVTEGEFRAALVEAEEQVAEANAIKTTPLKGNTASVKKPNSRSQGIDPVALAKLLKGQRLTGFGPTNLASNRFVSNTIPRSGLAKGGKLNYKKTHKKRKSSKKQRKTRRSKK